MHDRIIAIVLAGGKGSRFGRLKQIEPVGGSCLLGAVAENALKSEGIDRIIIVLGAEADAVISALGNIIHGERIEIVINEQYESGLSSSLRAGLERAAECGCDAAIFLLGDMPMIDAATIDTVISHYRSSNASLCYVKSDDHPGHPIIAGSDLFDEFMSIEGDIGGREIVRRHLDTALGVVVDHGEENRQLDINTQDDMDTYRSLIGKRAGRRTSS